MSLDKPRRLKSREVSSRFLSTTSSTPTIESLLRQKPRSSTDSRKLRTIDDLRTASVRGLWPSSSTTITTTTTTTSSSSQPSNKELGTLADHLGNARLKDLIHDKNIENSDDAIVLSRQRSCLEISRFDNDKGSTKENHKPLFGASMRYTGKFKFPGRSSTSSSKSSSQAPSAVNNEILPGRFSVDENTLRRKSASETSTDTPDSESESTSFGSPVIRKSSSASYMAPTLSSRKSGIEVPSKYLTDSSSKSRRWSSDSNPTHPVSFDGLPPKKLTIKSAMKRANSLTTSYGTAATKWALSPGRSGSPPMSVESKERPLSFSSLKPPTSPSRPKGVGNLLSMGLDLFKSKKSSSISNCSSPLGPGNAEMVHQLRLLQNRLGQWRYGNARAEAVNGSIANQAENNLVYASESLRKLRHSVLQRKLKLEKEKLEMKLNFIVHSQIKPLEKWGDIERQHLSAVSMTKDCLHSVVCKVPLVEGAKLEPQSTSIALRHASDLTASIKSMLSTFSPTAEKTVSMLSELAEVAAQEKALLEECLEIFRTISTLEIEERSLKCSVIQLRLWWQQHQQLLQQQDEILS